MNKEDQIFLLPESFKPEHNAHIRSELSGVADAPARLFVAGETSSTFDLAWKLVEMDELPEWGAALALSQGSGRGQLRRGWFSPLGNLHVSFRLPEDGVFDGSAATVILGLLFCEAFAELGLALKLKWPNDLILEGPGGPGKLGGILLEEKNGVLIAGVGINSAVLPPMDELRSGATLQPALLPEDFAFRTPVRLWLRLVHCLIMRYSEVFMAKSCTALLHRAEEKLLWRGKEVTVSAEAEGEEPIRGVITGLADDGGLMLLIRGENGMAKSRVITSGSIAGV